MILAGDVGGTKTILALFNTEGNNVRCLKKEQFSSTNYQTFTDLLTSFLIDVDCALIVAVCVGVAGVIVNGSCETTNLPWILSIKEMGELVNSQNAWLLNDLEATAWGLLDLPAHDFVELNPNVQPLPEIESVSRSVEDRSGRQQGNIAVIAAGTGLGEAIIAWTGSTYHIIATEGGHTDFSPTNEQEIALLRYLLGKYPGHISCERLISGEGLVNIYQFLKHINYASVNLGIEQEIAVRDPAAVIGEAGVAGEDALCVEALRLFCRLYGAESGNLALKCLPYGGVYLAGGIGAKILPVLQQGEFMHGFLAKGRCRAVLQKISAKVCTNPEVALLGALSYARKQLSSTQTLADPA
ncbi:glucokinase [Candidatus Methylobacter oryzae]|uniref:Glucokinase n=1 Tax=Candidatus Methylobacter oryzae TaxID=2497749 RepID=A0ABY3CF14_9GAMM|nr:glucokinase [Candidatus Methylobacter oryzae]TRX01918.1 glucokinase [Candidatus Methylobacter oryzae]